MDNLHTRFCDLAGISVPIVQAPIGGPSTPALAAAVSQVGGLGMLAGSWASPQQLRDWIGAVHERTDRPFGVNLILEWPQLDRFETCLAHGARIVSTFWGDPAPFCDVIHDVGALHLHTVASAAEARQAVEVGVDVILAQSWEAGGHILGEVATMPLVPAVVDAVAPVPVIAAGGIADGRGLAAVLALGADAAWIGTRFLLAEEAGTAEIYRQSVADAVETDTTQGIVFDIGLLNAPHRALRNSTARAWEQAGRPAPGERPREGEIVGHWADGRDIPRYADIAPVAGLCGDLEAMALYAGQSAGITTSVKCAAELHRDAVRVLSRFA